MELSSVHTEKDYVEYNMEDLVETFGEKLVTLAEPIWEIQKRAKEKKSTRKGRYGNPEFHVERIRHIVLQPIHHSYKIKECIPRQDAARSVEGSPADPDSRGIGHF
jgi:hypothetical protein